jgi:glycosyltransferase involved in cell wall biosynthesis
MNFSVLMSVYNKEKPQYLEQALDSVKTQTLQGGEFILVEDGPLTSELYAIIDKYVYSPNFKVIKIPINRGLSNALNVGLQHCSYELIVRMDSDDVAVPQRFERQVFFMIKNPEIHVCSAWLEEKDAMMRNTIFLKKLPVSHDDLIHFARRRNPLNHPATIFRKSSVLSVGGYPTIFPEDYALWSLMLVKGYKIANIPEVLVHMRTGDDFMARRGISFFLRETGLLWFQKKIGFYSSLDVLVKFALLCLVRLPPLPIRKLLYNSLRG